MEGADGSVGRASGLFEGALGEMIDGTGQPVSGLNEQFERVVLKRVCAYSGGAKSCGDVVARLSRIKRRRQRQKPSRERSPRWMPICRRASSESSPIKSRLKGGRVSVRAQVRSRTSSIAEAERFWASSSTRMANGCPIERRPRG